MDRPTPPLIDNVPKVILAALLLIWIGSGLWIALKAPFGSGTDESIKYVAFAAEKNRWATEEDFRRHGIEHFYYPPLYFLAFAPFWSDEPSFVEGYPKGNQLDRNYLNFAGRRVLSTAFLSRVPAPLVRLYRQAKLFSLALGLVALLSLAATLRLLFSGGPGWWVVLLGSAPAILLPQFLYYSTLVNNDNLVNALGALASLAFAAAVLALERGNERSYYGFGLATAACIGLAFLTKMSAPVLVPLVFGLAWARWEHDRGAPRQLRVRRALVLLAALAVVVVVCGGWWLGYKAWQGDWNSFKAHRLAHPWAIELVSPSTDPTWWADKFVRIARSYYAQFAGALYISVPDRVFLGWLLVPCALSGLAAARGVSRFRGRSTPVLVDAGSRARTVIWVTFAGVLLLNLASILVNIRFFRAGYGRLLFPSLVVLHAMAAAVVFDTLRRRPRVLAGACLGLVVYLGLLFGWTFQHRMVTAVLQPPEDVRVVTGIAVPRELGPIWEYVVAQPLRLSRGDLVALRLDIARDSVAPQLGAWIDGTLELMPAGGASRSVPLRRLALGESDFGEAWPELELESSIRLDEDTTAVLHLKGSPPWWLPALNTFNYRCSSGGHPANLNGAGGSCALCVAGVYR